LGAGGRRIAPDILNGSTRCRVVVILTPWPLYVRKRPTIPTEKRGHRKQSVYFEKKISLAQFNRKI
jgi:hypothetical protein